MILSLTYENFSLAFICSLIAPPIIIAIARGISREWSERYAPLISLFFLALALTLVLYLNPFKLVSLQLSTVIAKAGYLSKLLLDPIGLFFTFFTLLVTFIIVIAMFHTRSYYSEREGEVALMISILHLSLLGILLVYLSSNLLMLFVSWELMSICIYTLILARREHPLMIEASVKYLILSSFSSAFLLYGIALLYMVTGTLSLNSKILSTITVHTSNMKLLILGLIFASIAFSFKAAIVPFHTWAPDVYQASLAPLSAYFSAIASKAGIFGIIRLVTSYWPLIKVDIVKSILTYCFIAIALTSMFIANISALLQENLKRLLAYSSINHMGFTLLAISCLTPLGLIAAAFHSFNHALTKALLFLACEHFELAKSTVDLKDIAGVGRRIPAIGVPLTLGFLSILGIPGLNCFLSEYLIFYALIQAKQYIPLSLAIINLIIALFYYLRPVNIICIRRHSEGKDRLYIGIVISLLILCLICIFIGVYPKPIFNWLNNIKIFLEQILTLK